MLRRRRSGGSWELVVRTVAEVVLMEDRGASIVVRLERELFRCTFMLVDLVLKM